MEREGNIGEKNMEAEDRNIYTINIKEGYTYISRHPQGLTQGLVHMKVKINKLSINKF